MTDTAGTMRVIPTTVSAGAIGISDTTGINRQNWKNSYTRPNRKTLPRPRSVEIDDWAPAGTSPYQSGCKALKHPQNACVSCHATGQLAV